MIAGNNNVGQVNCEQQTKLVARGRKFSSASEELNMQDSSLESLGIVSRSSSVTTTDLGYHTLASSYRSEISPDPAEYQLPSTSRGSTLTKHSHALQAVNPFDKLTDDLILKILSTLSAIDLCRSCSRVCRRFYYLSWDPFLWQDIIFSDTGEGDINADRGLKAVLRLLSRDVYCREKPSYFRDNLNYMNYSSLSKSLNHAKYYAPLPVGKVKLDGCLRLSDRGLVLVARKCSDLRQLQLRGCPNITDLGLNEIMTRCSLLEKVDLTGCSNLTLNITLLPQHLSRLQYLDLSDCHQIDDYTLKKFLKLYGTQVSHLYLRRCALITDHSVKSLSNYCPLLRELSLSDCLQLTDYSCFELSSKLGPSIRYLSLAKCEQISDVGISQIGRFCYKLRYLNVRGCEAISDEGLVYLATSCGPRLKALDVGKCDISDEGLKVLSENCPNLKKLSIRECDLVTDAGVSLVAYYCRLLTHLNIVNCSYLTIEGYRYVKRFCKRCTIQHSNPGFY